MIKKIAAACSVIVVSLMAISGAHAHCQIPCGIYDDERKFEEIEEHAKTIEKAMDKIKELSAKKPANYHMIARWTNNKEEHAQEIQDIVHQYFLTQRVKAKKADDKKGYEAYVKHTTLLHQMLVAAMKSKQTIDTKNVTTLRELAKKYKAHYMKPHGHSH